MSLGLDTTVVLRLLTGQPAAEAEAAKKRLEQAVADQEEVVATDLVLAEAYFALQYHYGTSKDEARHRILSMLRSNVILASPREAIRAFVKAQGAGVVDRLIHERHRCSNTVTLTFDRKMGALEGAVRLSGRR
jgi:predicted nucleic-acid-binding protein